MLKGTIQQNQAILSSLFCLLKDSLKIHFTQYHSYVSPLSELKD